ncbi:MAG: hypothetical protein LBL04_14780 [Bacteroidales bacterium]|nr:hypothetical protein [Bacteroidales bacterium]
MLRSLTCQAAKLLTGMERNAKARIVGAKAPKPKAAAAKFNCDPSDVMPTCGNTRGFPETAWRYRFPVF